MDMLNQGYHGNRLPQPDVSSSLEGSLSGRSKKQDGRGLSRGKKGRNSP
jgi:hypothetical protein